MLNTIFAAYYAICFTSIAYLFVNDKMIPCSSLLASIYDSEINHSDNSVIPRQVYIETLLAAVVGCGTDEELFIENPSVAEKSTVLLPVPSCLTTIVIDLTLLAG